MPQISKSPKDPIRDAPLREPGQSLRKSLDDLLLDTVAPWLVVALLALYLAAIEWLRWWFEFSPHPVVLTIIAIAIVLIAIRKIRVAKAKAKDLKLGLKGERSIGQLLQTELLPLGYQLFHDCSFDDFNVDHVAVGPGGIFAIETKTWSKPHGDAQVFYDGETVTINGVPPDRDPVAQAKAGADSIERVLKKFTGQTTYVRPVVLFPGWFVKGKSSGAAVWVLNPDAFIAWVKTEKVRLSPDQVQFFAAGLARFDRSTS